MITYIYFFNFFISECVKVLIVDDDAFNTASLENILQKNFKIKVDKAMDGSIAY